VPSREVRAARRAGLRGYHGPHFTQEEWEELLEACGHRCLRCGAAEDLSVDHVVPLSLGGYNTIENVQPLCVRCNEEKAATIRDYRPASDQRSCPRGFPRGFPTMTRERAPPNAYWR
jgi:5-methylcytosine-specific restriction endonuclease McrA